MLQRRLRIADAIRREGSVRVDALSERLGVSAVTVRGDLAYLEAQGMVLRSAGIARAMPDPLPPPRTRPLLPMTALRAAAPLLPDSGTVLLGPGPSVLRLLLLLGADGATPDLLLCAVDAVPVARQCTDAALHLLGGAIDAGGVLGGPAALATLALHAVSLFVVEARAVRGDALVLRDFASGAGEAFVQAAAARASCTLVLLTGEDGRPGGAGALLPLAAANAVLSADTPGPEARDALRRAGLVRSGGGPLFRRPEERNTECGRKAS